MKKIEPDQPGHRGAGIASDRLRLVITCVCFILSQSIMEERSLIHNSSLIAHQIGYEGMVDQQTTQQCCCHISNASSAVDLTTVQTITRLKRIWYCTSCPHELKIKLRNRHDPTYFAPKYFTKQRENSIHKSALFQCFKCQLTGQYGEENNKTNTLRHLTCKQTFEKYVSLGNTKSKQFKVVYDKLISVCHKLLFFICLCVLFVNLKQNRTRSSSYSDYDKPVHKQNYYSRSCEQQMQTGKPWHFVFDFTYTFPTNLTVSPFSVNDYATDIVKKNISGEPLMKYEWSRYLSFNNFPTESPMMPLRLAQAGFYYTGQGQEVKCFCCGLTNSVWSREETAMDLHRRKSPSCKFLRREDSDNVSIHVPEYYNDVFRTTPRAGDAQPTGATGGPEDLSNTSQRNGTIVQANSNHNMQPEQDLDTHTNHNSNITTHRNPNRGRFPGDQSGCEAPQRPRDTQQPMNADIKHPDYANRATRLASFQSWPYTDIQDPAELADAGLFYAGVRDCVRCYYCGVGLKNWEKEDNPWTEHKRWSNTCGHLLQSACNGESPVDQRSDDQGHEAATSATTSNTKPSSSLNNNASGTSPATGNNRPETSLQNGGSVPGSSLSQRNHSHSDDTRLDSVAARSILEMGYSAEAVSMAIQQYLEINDSEPNNSTSIMELILEAEDDGQRPATMRSNVEEKSSQSNGPHTSTSEHSTPTLRPSTPKSELSTPTSNIKGKTGNKKRINGEAQSLIAQNKVLKEQMLCKICMDRDADVVFLPCGHLVSCQRCAVALRKCAVCRDLIRGSVRVYQS